MAAAPKTVKEKSLFALPVVFDGKIVLTVEKGEKVEEGQVLGKIVRKKETLIDLAAKLGVRGKKALAFLAREFGEGVGEGEIVARKKSLFGKKEAVSPVSGRLASLDDKGMLTIETVEEEELKAEFAGEIKKIEESSLEMVLPAWVVEAKDGRGEEVRGKIMALASLETMTSLEADQVEGKILAVAQFNRTLWYKAAALGAAALVFPEQEGESEPCLKKDELPFLILPVESEFWPKAEKEEDKEAICLPAEKKLVILN